MTELRSEKEKLEDSMTTVKDEISRLDAQLEESKRRERLLIENPDHSASVDRPSSGKTTWNQALQKSLII